VSPRYALVFLLLAGLLAVAGWSVWETTAAGSVGLWYAACAFAWLAAGYAGLGPVIFCKRAAGVLSPIAWLLLGPYLLLNAVTFWFYRRGSREPAFAQAGENLYFGRRLIQSEAEIAVRLGWQSVLDLAGEFSEARSLRAVPRYRSLPILDATAPTEQQLRSAVEWLQESIQVGPTYVHCALGHGRTATAVLAYLLTSRAIDTIDEGLSALRAQRGGVELCPAQVACLRPLESRGQPQEPEA
jgi:hypothetical protein